LFNKAYIFIILRKCPGRLSLLDWTGRKIPGMIPPQSEEISIGCIIRLKEI